MSRRASIVASLLVGIAVGALLLWLVGRRLDPRTVWNTLRAAEWLPIAGALLAIVAMQLAKAYRWSGILKRVVALEPRAALAGVLVGAAGNLLVSHIGELFRVILAARRSGGAMERLLMSIGVERVFDIGVIFVLVIGASLALGADGLNRAQQDLISVLGLLGFAVVCGLGVVMASGSRLVSLIEGGEQGSPSPLRGAIGRRLRGALETLLLFQDHRQSLVVAGWSLLMWVMVAGCIFLCIRSIAPDGATVIQSIIVLGVQTIALALPTPPARIGTTQASFAIALSGSGLSATQIFAASLIYTLVMTVPLLLAGGIIWRIESRRAGRRPAVPVEVS